MPLSALSTASVLAAACETTALLGVFPVRFEAGPGGARVLAVMPAGALVERSTGPYSREDVPPEAVRMVEAITRRWADRPDRPDLTVGMASPWPELTLALPASGVRVVFVVPEAAPPGWRPEPGDSTAEIDVELALEAVARSLAATGEDLPVRVSVDYPRDPGHGTDPRSVLPVVPTVSLDRRRCTEQQRRAHNDALRAAVPRPFDLLGGTAFTARLGWARIQDLDP